jgi:GAF domain-containing protein
MSTPINSDAFDQMLSLDETVLTAKDLDNLGNTVIHQVADFTAAESDFLFVRAPQILKPRFYEKNISENFKAELKSICEDKMDHLSEQARSSTEPIAWSANNEFTVYPLRKKSEYIGFLGMRLNGNALPVSFSSKYWERFLNMLSSTIYRLSEQYKLERELAHLNTYMTVSSMLAQSMGLGEILETALYCCMEICSAEAAAVLLLDDEKENFYFYKAEGPNKMQLKNATLPADQGIAGFVNQSGISEVINDVPSDHRYYKQISENSGYPTRNMIAIPLVAGEEPIGVLEVINKVDHKDFTETEHLSLMTIAEEVAFAVRNAKIFEYVVDSYCKQRQGFNTCAGCKRPLGSWTPCVKYREETF